MLTLIMKDIIKNKMYIVHELDIFHNYLEWNYKSFYLSATALDVIPSHRYFHYILQLVYQLNFFYTYSFYNLNLQFTFTIARILVRSFITHSFVDQLFAFTSAFIFTPSLFIITTLASSLHLYLQVSCHFMHLVSLVLEIRLNTFTFMFSLTSGTHNFVYGLLILLQLPLHLLTLTL